MILFTVDIRTHRTQRRNGRRKERTTKLDMISIIIKKRKKEREGEEKKKRKNKSVY